MRKRNITFIVLLVIVFGSCLSTIYTQNASVFQSPVATEEAPSITHPLIVIPVSKMLLQQGQRCTASRSFREACTNGLVQTLVVQDTQEAKANLSEVLQLYRNVLAHQSEVPQLFVITNQESLRGSHSDSTVFLSDLDKVLRAAPTTCPSFGFCRTFAAPQFDLFSGFTSCKLVHNQQIKETGAMPNHAFRVPEPIPRGYPIVVSTDLLRFIDHVFGDILLSNESILSDEGPTIGQVDELLPHPLLAACGIASLQLGIKNRKLRALLRRWGSSPPTDSIPLSLAECLPLLWSGRDLHRFRLNDLVKHTKHEITACVNQPAMLFDATEEYPFSALSKIDRDPSDLSASYFRYSLPETEGGVPVGYPNVVMDNDLLQFGQLGFRASTLLRLREKAQQQQAPFGTGAVTAVLYVPLVVTNFGARDLIRCFHLSLPPSTRQAVPLHFALGTRYHVDTARKVENHVDIAEETENESWRKGTRQESYRQYDTMIVNRWSASLWHRLARENRSFTGGGDLLLFDVPDHDDRTLSAMLMKVLLCMVHMTVKYPTAAYFLRGADDAHHVVPRLYSDLTRVLRRKNDLLRDVDFGDVPHEDSPSLKDRRFDLGRHGQWVRRRRMADGHVTSRLMIKRCRTGETDLPLRWHPAGRSSTRSRYCRPSRNIGPVAYPFYVTGGGGVYSDDVTTRLAASLSLLPPLYFLEEDVNLGRLTAPLAAPFDTTRIHNFFNSTVHVDYAVGGSLPRAFEYCWSNDWIVHKHPRDSLERVDDETQQITCDYTQWAARSINMSRDGPRPSQCFADTVARWRPLGVSIEANPLRHNHKLYQAASVQPKGKNRWDSNGFERGGTECRGAEKVVKTFVGRTECDK